ncbi:hypothetical protein [Acidovorax sp. Q11]
MSEFEITHGSAIRTHTATNTPVLYGRVVHVDKNDDLVVVIRVPERNDRGHKRNYVKAPIFLRLSSFLKQLERREYSVCRFDTPSHWLLTNKQLQENSTAGLDRNSRRNLSSWLKHRDAAYELIRPFVEGRTVDQIVMDPELKGWPAKRATSLNRKATSRIQSTLNAYLLALGEVNGLLPWYSESGAPGKKKIGERKTGRPREFSDLEAPNLVGLNCDENVRKIFALGWKKFKKPGISVKTAFDKTLSEWFCKSIRWNGTTATVKLRPEAFQYSQQQFEYWGTKDADALSAQQIERGETPARRAYERRQGRIKDRHFTINGEGFLDSTSSDQTLVSCASRLKVLGSPWRTDVMGANVDYIFGHHVGFENVSGMTALLAVLHAAEDKVEYCDKYGIKIKPRDWLATSFRTLIMDNGEGKGSLVMTTLDEMEIGAAFGSAYDSINKAPVESGHRRMQKSVDHLMPGATMGRRARRGEPARALLARQNLFEYMPSVIQRVLYHNNTEVIDIPTLEMRRDGIEPTRRGVVEWMRASGYVTSTAIDLPTLRIKCLPRLKAFLSAEGLHLYDPLYSGKRVIKKLVYTSEWLKQSALLSKAHAHRWALDAHMDPSDISQVWCNLNGLQRMQLKTSDPEMTQLSLLDWLSICSSDRYVGFLSRVDEVQEGVSRVKSISLRTKHADSERKKEIRLRGRAPTKSEMKRNIRINTAEERSALSGVPRLPKKKENPLTDELIARHDSQTTQSGAVVPEIEDVMRALRGT